MISKLVYISFMFLFFFQSSLFSETILLRNGQIIQGKVLGHDSESVTINSEGATKVIPKSTVHKVIFSSNSAELQKFLNERNKQNYKRNQNLTN